MLTAGRSVFWAVAAVLGMVLFTTYDRLPPLVASHFDIRGTPNGWASRSTHALVILAIGMGLPLGIVALIRLLTRNGSPERLNIPGREYWTRPEHGREAVRRVRAYTWWLGSVMAGTALLVHALILAANGSRPPRLRSELMYSVLGGVLLAIGAWAVGWTRLLRPPPGSR